MAKRTVEAFGGAAGARPWGRWVLAAVLLAGCGGELDSPADVIGLGPDGERIDRTPLVDLESEVALARVDPAAQDVDTLVRSGFALYEEGRFSEAAARFLLAADERPVARSFAAWALLEESALEKSYALAVQAERDLPEAPVVHFVLGLAASANGRDDEAAEAYRRVLELSPADVAALNNLGTIAYRAERFDDARALMERAFDAASAPVDIALLHANLAELDALDGDLRSAEERLDLAMEQAPGQAFVHFSLGALYDVTGREEAARHEMSAGAELDPLGSTRRAISFVWPELRLHFDALRAEALNDFDEARRLWTQLAAIESGEGLRWSPLAGRASAHLERLDAFATGALALR